MGEWLDDAMPGEASNWVVIDIAESTRGLTTVSELLVIPVIELGLNSRCLRALGLVGLVLSIMSFPLLSWKPETYIASMASLVPNPRAWDRAIGI